MAQVRYLIFVFASQKKAGASPSITPLILSFTEMAVSVGVGTSDEKKKDIIAVYWQEIVLTLKANFFVPFEQFKDN